MPSAITDPSLSSIRGGHESARSRLSEPAVYSGSLDAYEQNDITTSIGREIPSLQIKDILSAEASDDLIRDLAITVSQRGVVFLRNQDASTQDLLALGQKLSKLTGSPDSSTLHIHPITEANSELGDQISVISSVKQKKGSTRTAAAAAGDLLKEPSRFASNGWHADITFEPVPSDYAILKIHTLPPFGGDTLWSSGYEVYDRLSPATAAYLEGLTAIHDASFFNGVAERLGHPLREEVRGNELNQGKKLQAVHPVIRTNPVTGWKTVFVNKGFTKRIVELTKDESDVILEYLFKLIAENHDNQVRFKWRQNDVAIWDNRSNYHTATYDYEDTRIGDRVVALGEAPYFDANSTSRKAARAEKELPLRETVVA